MANCLHCGKSGFFLATDNVGMCSQCHEEFFVVVPRRLQIIKESINIINETGDVSTSLSRFDVAFEHLEFLYKEYESRGIISFSTLPSKAIKEMQEMKEDMVVAALIHGTKPLSKKVNQLKTEAAKNRAIANYQEKIDSYKYLITKPNLLNDMDQIIPEFLKDEEKKKV